MKYDPEVHHRHSIRLKGHDYSRPGWYYLTVCTHERDLLFGEVVEGQMRRNRLGDVVQEEWFATARVRPDVHLDAFIVMPNHIHGIMQLLGATQGVAPGARRRLAPTSGLPKGPMPGSVGAIVGQIKSLTKKGINKARGTPGKPVWQVNYCEHVIRSEVALNRILEYICQNPARWPYDPENPARCADIEDESADILSGDSDPKW